MSMKREFEVTCPKCGRKSSQWAWLVVNVQASPELKLKLLDRGLNLVHCDCGFEGFLAANLRYVDEEKRFCVQLTSFVDIEDVLDELSENGEFRMDAELWATLPESIKHIRLVFAMDELASYVTLRDILAGWRGTAEGNLFVCYACGGEITTGEHYFCVSRSRQIRGDGDESKDEIVDAMASIQVCNACRVKAATQDVTFPSLPLLPTLALEKQSISRFARWRSLAGVAWKPVAKGRASCSLCQTPVAVGDTYTRVELREEVGEGKGAFVKESYTLAILCEKCAEKYLEWL